MKDIKFFQWMFVVVVVTVLKAEEANGLISFQRPLRPNQALELQSQKADSDNKETMEVDYNHAHECADHFGMCSTQELEEMKKALHRERIQNIVKGTTGVNHPLGPAEELDRRILEDDLAKQLNMLQLEELKHQNDVIFLEDSKVLIPKMSHLMEEVEQEILLEPELSEMAVLTMALLFVLYAPHVLGIN